MRALKIQSKNLLNMEIIFNSVDFVLHIKVKTKSSGLTEECIGCDHTPFTEEIALSSTYSKCLFSRFIIQNFEQFEYAILSKLRYIMRNLTN